MSDADLVTSLPLEHLPASAAIDALHLAARIKIAFRSHLTTPASAKPVRQWCESHGLALHIDADSYICVARSSKVAAKILEVDRSAEPHERALGQLLSYPACCCDLVASVGEANIDALAEEIGRRSVIDEYGSIDPSGYLQGESLICHLPCSASCSESLEIARRALEFVIGHQHEQGFERWNKWVAKVGR